MILLTCTRRLTCQANCLTRLNSSADRKRVKRGPDRFQPTISNSSATLLLIAVSQTNTQPCPPRTPSRPPSSNARRSNMTSTPRSRRWIASSGSRGNETDLNSPSSLKLCEYFSPRSSPLTHAFLLGSIGGYPKGLTFGCTIGERDPSGRDDFLAYHKSAITIPGPAITRIEAIAKQHDVFIVSGVIEKDGGTLYCSVLWVHPEHGLVGKRRKLYVPL